MRGRVGLLLMVAVSVAACGGANASPSVAPSPSSAVSPAPSETAEPSAALRSVPVPIDGATPVFHGPRDKKVIALTFDDGWSPRATRQILAILEADGVAATFFPYGFAVRVDPELWRAVAAAGYPIGNHTVSHPDLTRLSPDQVRWQLTAERALVEGITGTAMAPFMRPPDGKWSAATRLAALAAGYTTMVLWDVDSRDWTGISAAAIVDRATRGVDGSIVLFHAGPKETPLALPAIIAAYRARGFTFVTIPELLGEPSIPRSVETDRPRLFAEGRR
jgi:peptidoglycan/xylan/chitin deacetylase (PgdA/CDA1 family)